MATTFNDALQEFNIGTLSTTNVNNGNVVIPEGSETLSDLIKLNYDFKETPFNPESKSYNIYLWNNNTDGEIRFYTKDAKNNNDFNKDFLSGNYSEPRLNFNTKIGKNGKLYYWHNFTLTNPAKLSGWYEISDNISNIESQLIFLDGLTGGLSASLILTNNNVGLLTGRVSIVEDAIILITTDLNMLGDDVISLRRSTQSIWDYMDFNNNPTIQNKLAEYIEAIQPYNLTQGLFDEANQLVRIQASSGLSAYRINLANNFTSTIGAVAFAGAVLGGIKYISDTQQKNNYSTELIRITDTLAKRPISSSNNTLIHTGITKVSGASGFPITNNEFIITIQKEAVLIINIDSLGIANIILVDQIGVELFNVNESITIDRTLLNGSSGNLVLNVTSLGTLKQWTELKTIYLQNKISKIDTKNRRKAGVIGYNDVNTEHFTNVDATYTDYNGSSSEVIAYKTLEINPDYKSPTAIQADSATNADTANVAVKLQTKRKIANVDFDGSANIDISYTDLINKPTSFSDNIGIGTASSPSYNLDIYNQTTARIRIQSSSDFGATSSIEFRKGVVSDVWSDYRLINDNSTFKLQYENNDFPYGDGNNIITWNRTNVVNYIPIKFNDNVGIKTDPHNTYAFDVNGASRFIGNIGASTAPHNTYAFDVLGTSRFIGNIGASTAPHNTYAFDVLGTSRFTGNIGVNTTPHATYKIDCLGEINSTSFRGDGANITNLTLTTAKIYERCEPKTFIINPSDKIDIPPVYSFNITAFDRLANTTATYLEAGKFTCTYEDRNGTYKLIPSYIPNTNNKVLLNYRVGDKITFKHTANTQFDYTEVPAVKWARLSVFKMPSGTAWTSQGMELYMTSIFDWDSDLTTVVDWTSGSPVSYPRNTPVTMQLETGFKYFFVKWQRNNDPITFNSYITPATEASGMNIAYGGGQGFKISGDYSGSGGYKPISSMLPPLMTTDTEGTARRGSRLTIDNGVLSADIPISSDLITVMKPEHFINNTGTNKIEISTAYVAPNATKLATSRNIAGVGFDGSGNIDIPYFNLTNKITVGTGLAITTGSATTSPNITISLAPSATKLATARAIAGVDFDGTTAINIPYFNLTNKITVGTGLAITTGSTTTSPNITISLAPSATKLATARAIAGVDFDGTTAINIPYFNLTNKITVGSGLAITAGSATVSPDITLSLAEANIPTLSISKISGLQGAIDGKAPTSHTHAITDITGLQGALDGKAPTSHTHAITDITNLQGALDSKQATLSPGGGITIVGTTISAPAGTTTWLVSAGTPLTKVYYNAGNVGIGTTDPQYNLDIHGTSPVSIHLFSPAQGSSLIRYREAVNLGFDVGYAGGANRYSIYSYNNDPTAVEHFSITRGAGRVAMGGIPTTLSRLKVYGYLTETLLAEFALASGASGVNIGNNYIATAGTDANISLNIQTKGTGGIFLQAPSGTTRMTINGSTGGVSMGGTLSAGATTITGNSSVIGNLAIGTATAQLSITGNSINAQGSDANIPITITTKGTSSFGIRTGATPTTRLSISELGSVTIGGGISSGSITSSGTVSVGPIAAFTRISAGSIFVAGNDVSIPLAISAKGVGDLTFTTNTTTRLTISGSTGNAIFANDISVAGLSTLTGRVGIGKAPHATYACDVLGDVNISGLFRIGGIPISNTATVWTTSGVNIYNNNTGNVGIGTATPQSSYKLQVEGNTYVANTLVFNNNFRGGGADYACNKISLYGGGNTPTTTSTYGFGVAGSTLEYFTGGSGSGNHKWYYGGNGGTSYGTVGMELSNNNLNVGANITAGSATINGDTFITSSRLVLRGSAPTLYLRDTDAKSGMIHMNGAIMYFLNGSGSDSETWSPVNGSWALTLNMTNNEAIFGGSVYTGYIYSGASIDVAGALNAGGQITGGFYAVSQTNTDHLVVMENYANQGTYAVNTIKVGHGSFTAFHRCYTDDELYNNETDENIDIFKNNYMGRVVIATGKIKTDFTRDNEWYSGIDKDGIAIEDSIPVVALSRKKKDKRVFGVFGATKRSTNNKNRLIVNSIGEGAICVSNTNGNIENGDYLQSSDLLGYGEKQDDDILHNYTIGKATIDCNFELDSPYYQCHEIENGVRVAFIACSYHCG